MNELQAPNVKDDSDIYLVMQDYQSDYQEDLKVEAGDYVTVMRKDISGWWLGQNRNNEMGWIPASFLEEKSIDKIDNKLSIGKLGDAFIALKS